VAWGVVDVEGGDLVDVCVSENVAGRLHLTDRLVRRQ